MNKNYTYIKGEIKKNVGGARTTPARKNAAEVTVVGCEVTALFLLTITRHSRPSHYGTAIKGGTDHEIPGEKRKRWRGEEELCNVRREDEGKVVGGGGEAAEGVLWREEERTI